MNGPDLRSLGRPGVLRCLKGSTIGGGVLPREIVSLSCRLGPLAMVGAPPLRPAFREPFKALRGGSLTAGSLSSGSVSSTKL